LKFIMNKFNILIMAVLICTLASAYDYYTFAIEWAGSICDTEQCSSSYDQGLNTKNLNIHGLWPSVYSGTQPSNCPGPTWNPSSINSTTTSAMVANWSGLYSSADAFHQHEWQTHGTCWTDPSSGGNKINDFFSQVIAVNINLNIYDVLINGGITPSSSTTYSTTQINSVMTKALNVNSVNIICSQSSEDFLSLDYGDYYFNGFYLCLDLTYKPISCPSSAALMWESYGSGPECPSDTTVKFPPIQL